MTKTEMQAEALARAEQSQSSANYAAIFTGFTGMGIAESDIMPRVNVFTFQAWKAKGRSVKKGEHGVKVVTFIDASGTERDPSTGEKKTLGYRRPHTTTVFHISQTELTSEWEARRASNPRPRGGYRRRGSYDRSGMVRGETYVRDPGEDAADRWNESHGDRWIER